MKKGKIIMKKLVVSLMLILTFFVLLSIGAFAINEIEDNNSYNKATEIEVNTSVTGNLSSSSDADWYKITVPQRGVISVDFKHDNLYDDRYYWSISLFKSNGSTRVSEGSASYDVKGNEDLKLPEFGVSSGTYYVRIEDKNVFSSANYSFQVTYSENAYYETENNNSTNAADLIELNTVYYGGINQSSDVDWYKVIVTENGTISVDFKHENLYDNRNFWIIELYHSDGSSKVSGYNSTYVWGTNNSVSYEFGVSAGNTYYIKISDGDYFSSTTYSFSVIHKKNEYYETETNNSFGKATPIEFGQRYYGSITHNGDLDWYKIVIKNSMKFVLSFDHTIASWENEEWYLELYTANGTSYLTNIEGTAEKYAIKANSNRTLPAFNVSAGTYYIKVSPGSSSWWSNMYSFIITENHNCTGTLKTTKEPTCTGTGLKGKTCTICGTLFDIQSIEANGHSSDNWVVDVPATCTSEGECHATCNVCEKDVSEIIPAIDHTLGEWTTTLAPTCYDEGTQTKYCSNCDYSESETLDVLSHEYTEWSYYDEGLDKRGCNLCGSTESTPHKYGELKKVFGNRLIPPIVKEKTCDLCNHTITHRDWSNVWILILIIVVLVGATIGIISYVKAFKRR